jgi:hypothetical protein
MPYRYKLVRVLFNDSVTSAPDPAEDAEYVAECIREACMTADLHLLCAYPECSCKHMPAGIKALLRSPLMRGE